MKWLEAISKLMGRHKKPVAEKKEKIKFVRILGECHDGQDYKLEMKDGSVKIVAKEEIDK